MDAGGGRAEVRADVCRCADPEQPVAVAAAVPSPCCSSGREGDPDKGASTTGLVSGTNPSPAGRAASRKSSSRTCTLPQPAQKPENRAGRAAVTAALASPFTIGPVITSRIRSATTAKASSGSAPSPSSRPASPDSRALASAGSAGQSAAVIRPRSARRCRWGDPRRDQTNADQLRPPGSGRSGTAAGSANRAASASRVEPSRSWMPKSHNGSFFGSTVARSRPEARMRYART